MICNFHKKGGLLLEPLITITILGIVVLIVFSKFSQIRENQVLKTAVADVLSSIDKARLQTLSSLNSSQYGVHFQSDKVIIFKGTVFSSGASDNENILIITPATITNVTLNGVSGVSGEFYFNRLSGLPNVTGTVAVATTSFSKTVTISATGIASTN